MIFDVIRKKIKECDEAMDRATQVNSVNLFMQAKGAKNILLSILKEIPVDGEENECN